MLLRKTMELMYSHAFAQVRRVSFKKAFSSDVHAIFILVTNRIIIFLKIFYKKARPHFPPKAKAGGLECVHFVEYIILSWYFSD